MLPRSRNLFREGVSDKRTFYLVRGEVELRSADSTLVVVRAGTAEAKNPLAASQPRRFTARAVSEIEYLSIDCDLLDVLLTWDQTGTYEVSELTADAPVVSDDWMTTLLQTKAFHRIPASNLQAIFTRMQRSRTAPAKSSSSRVTKVTTSTPSPPAAARSPASRRSNREGVKLAVLGPGDTFGEEALISGLEAQRDCHDADGRLVDAPREG